MRTIQEVGTEILTNHPAHFYIFGGTEYGIKSKYIECLKEYYADSVEYPSLISLVDMMSSKHLIPLEPKLYIVRYDEDFVSKMTDTLCHKLKSCKIIGTIVCIYEQQKHITKLCKYLDDYIVLINAISPQFLKQYIISDFPQMPDRLVDIVCRISDNYNQAAMICTSICAAPVENACALSDSELALMFGKAAKYNDKAIRKYVASRNFAYLIHALDSYEDDSDSFLHVMLSTFLELEKVLTIHANSDLKEYASRWTKQDVYNMFLHTYGELRKSRMFSTDLKNSIVYLFGLLQFKPVPAWEEDV